MNLLAFVLGASVGGPLRFLIDKYFRSRYKFPFGILLVNITGSFIFGFTQTNYFVLGFCGAFTTWSTFMLDLDRQRSHYKSLIANLVVTIVASVLAIELGQALSRIG